MFALRREAWVPLVTRAAAFGPRAVLQIATRVVALPHRAVVNLALQDCAVLGLHGVLATEALLRVTNSERGRVGAHTFALFGSAALCVLLTRGEVLPPGTLRSLVYRFGMFGSMVGSYFVLRPLLPALTPVRFDVSLLRIDQLLFFGETPALWLDRFVTPRSVEWFAFFYYSYFWLLGLYLMGALFFDGGRRRYELLLASALVTAIGHIGYTIVPGAGPYACACVHPSFAHVLTGGAWWSRVENAVHSAGALLDIFPSLHTALSVLVGLHAFRHRRELPMRWTWLPTCFFVGNIVVATMFLRWHYGVDVLAGALLAFAAQRTAIFAWRWEGTRERRGRRQAVWEPALPAAIVEMDNHDRRLLLGVTAIHLCIIVALFVFSILARDH